VRGPRVLAVASLYCARNSPCYGAAWSAWIARCLRPTRRRRLSVTRVVAGRIPGDDFPQQSRRRASQIMATSHPVDQPAH